MKKVMYVIGLLSTMSFVTGWTLNMMNWPGGSLLSIYGFLCFAFVFMPWLALDYFKVSIQRTLLQKLKLGLGLASALAVAASLVFKLLHLQSAQLLLLIGAGLFAFGFLPFLFLGMYKKSLS